MSRRLPIEAAPATRNSDGTRRSRRSGGHHRRLGSSPAGHGIRRGVSTLDAAANFLLHPRPPVEPVWKYLWPVLGLAFAVRAAVALSGDFMLHPDEIMQYLEPAHRLVFGNGVVYWEFFHGARSWLLPGLIAGVLKLFDTLGLGQPLWYVGGVELVFCAISLGIPAGMYFFARRHFGESAARAALLAGAFWYELAGFAHKPMTELVATAPLMVLLALCGRPSPDKAGLLWLAAILAVLTAAIRIQYAGLAFVLLGLFFLRAGKRTRGRLVFAVTVVFLAVGVFDAATWDAGWFHSYLNNLRFNFALGDTLSGPSRAYLYLVWLLITGGGLSALCIALSLRDLHRYGFLLSLIVLMLLVHSLEANKLYRYIFAVAPLWLLVGADVLTRLAARSWRPRLTAGLAGAVFAAISLAGIMNVLPYQDEAYWLPYMPVRFLRDHPPVFAAYRHLARSPGVAGVWHVDRPYHELPGYYHLHRKVPFYDESTGRENHLHDDPATLRASVSHVLSEDPDFSLPGYVPEKAFGALRILRREKASPLRQWRDFTPTITDMYGERFMRRVFPDAPPPPANRGIHFVAPK